MRRHLASTLIGQILFLLALSLALAGCGATVAVQQDLESESTAAVVAGAPLRGHAHGGRQPITGAQIMLYAAGASGYASASTSLLAHPVFTDSQGLFDLNGNYTCTAGQQLYLVAIGGNTGSGTNPNASLFAAIGECSTITASTNVEMNEATTVGSVYALAPFMTSTADLGAPSANAAGLGGAFRSVNKLVNLATGGSTGSALPPGATSPSTTLNTLADILAACVNSTGGVAGDGSICGKLFAVTRNAAGVAPTNVVSAVLNVARRPTSNVSSLFALVPADSPFLPNLRSAPADWALSITYTGAGLNQPSSATLDDAGNLWITNTGNNTLSALTQGGSALPGSPFGGNGLNGPVATVIDSNEHVWVANKNGATVSVFSTSGLPWAASPINVGSNAVALALDETGNVWVANNGSNTLTVLNSAGVVQQTISKQGSAPTALAFHP